MGDPVGIGPEIVLKSVVQGLPAPAVVFGDADKLTQCARALGIDVDIVRIPDASASTGAKGRIEVIQTGPPVAHLPWGHVNATAGLAAYEYVCAAIDAARGSALRDRTGTMGSPGTEGNALAPGTSSTQGLLDTSPRSGSLRAIVTAPLNKASMHAAGIDYPGHTEILAERTGTVDFAMMLANDELRVLLATIHIALAEVPKAITPESQRRAYALAHRACVQMGIPQPRIAVAGLNPHAGESGKFGREEIDVIEPAIERARAAGLNVSGPWPPDTVFMRARQGDFDIVVAQYHDQGLIPVKYLGLDQGVNVTVGLPFIRTSVDHGTAFDIAGQGVADHASLIAACELACRMTPND